MQQPQVIPLSTMQSAMQFRVFRLRVLENQVALQHQFRQLSQSANSQQIPQPICMVQLVLEVQLLCPMRHVSSHSREIICPQLLNENHEESMLPQQKFSEQACYLSSFPIYPMFRTMGMIPPLIPSYQSHIHDWFHTEAGMILRTPLYLYV